MSVRTCVGCRRTAQQEHLLRFVARDHRVVPDGHVRQPGRGGYLHLSHDCLRRAVRRRAFSRALRVSHNLSVAALEPLLDQVPLASQNGDEMSYR